jgi:hypothetical protein
MMKMTISKNLIPNIWSCLEILTSNPHHFAKFYLGSPFTLKKTKKDKLTNLTKPDYVVMNNAFNTLET